MIHRLRRYKSTVAALSLLVVNCGGRSDLDWDLAYRSTEAGGASSTGGGALASRGGASQARNGGDSGLGGKPLSVGAFGITHSGASFTDGGRSLGSSTFVNASTGGMPNTDTGLAGHAGAASDSAGPEAAGRASSETLGSAGAAGASVASALGWYVDPAKGSDQNPGSFALPFKTLEHAAIRAQGGETVWLLNGNYDASTERGFADMGSLDCITGAGVSFASNVQIRALNSGQAHLLVTGYHGLCLAGGTVQGLRFECERAGRRILEVLDGVETIHESSFTNCGASGDPSDGDNSAIHLSGEARVSMTPGSLADMSGYPNYSLATVVDNAELAIHGGTVSAVHRALAVGGSGKLSLYDVNLVGQEASVRSGRGIFILDGAPKVTIGGDSSVSHFADGILSGAASVVLTVDGATFSDLTYGLRVQSTADDAQLVARFRHTSFTNSHCGLYVFPFRSSADLSITDCEFRGIESQGIMAMIDGRVSLDGVTMTRCGTGAELTHYSLTNPLSITMRRTQIVASENSGIWLAVHADTVVDLGTMASPGENTISGNHLSGTEQQANLTYYGVAPVVISAIGNTWDPKTQGTDASGRCSVTGVDKTLDLVRADGGNFYSQANNQAILRLAENPPVSP